MMRAVTIAALAGLFLVAVPAAGAASYKPCKDVVNPYAGTRFEGANLTSIRVLGGSCNGARVVAKGAHRKARGMTPPAPIRRFSWGGWRVVGDIRGATDSYLAVKGTKRVRWRF